MTTFTSFGPIYYICFFYGTIGPWKKNPSFGVRILCHCIFLSNISALIWYIYYYMNSSNVPIKSVSVYMNYIIIVAYSVIDVLVQIICYLFRNKIQLILLSLEEIDQLLLEANIKINHSIIRRLNVGILCLVQMCTVMQVVMFYWLQPGSRIWNVQVLYRLFYKQFYHQMLTVLVAGLVTSILWRMIALNAGMAMICNRQFLARNPNHSSFMCLAGVIKGCKKSTIYRFGRIHSKLCRLLPVIGEVCGIPIICFVSMYVVLLLFTMYKSFDENVLIERPKKKLATEWIPMLKTIVFFALMTTTCTRLRKEVSEGAV